MPGKDAPEFHWCEDKQLYRKRIKDETGKWVDVYGKTKQETRENVAAKLDTFKARAEAKDNPFCFEYAKQWYELWAAGKQGKYTENFRSAINNYILPEIGNTKLIDVTESDLKRVLVKSAGKSKSLNNIIVRTMKMIFSSAFNDGLIQKNPAAALKAGGEKPKGKVALTEKQQKTLLASIKDANINTFILIALYTGLRREEALALCWDYVFLDAETPYLSVRRALRWNDNNPIISDVLKSDAASRDIPIPPVLLKHLKQLKDKSSGDYVIGGVKPWTRSQFYRAWDSVNTRSTKPRVVRNKEKKPVRDDNGRVVTVSKELGDKIRNHPFNVTIDFYVTPHILRHTYITRLILSGANIKVVQYLAGHASVDITLNIYTHLMENRPKDTAGAVMAAFCK